MACGTLQNSKNILCAIIFIYIQKHFIYVVKSNIYGKIPHLHCIKIFMFDICNYIQKIFFFMVKIFLL